MLLINVKMPTFVGILTFISRINYRLWSSKPSIFIYFGIFSNFEQFKFYAQLSMKCSAEHEKMFINLGPGLELKSGP